MTYSLERKEAVLKKMLPLRSRSIPELAEEKGISAGMLYLWRKQARAQGRLLPDGDSGPEGWGSADKFTAVLETAALNEAQLAEYCRKRGVVSRAGNTVAGGVRAGQCLGPRAEPAPEGGPPAGPAAAAGVGARTQAQGEGVGRGGGTLGAAKRAAAIWGEDEVA